MSDESNLPSALVCRQIFMDQSPRDSSMSSETPTTSTPSIDTAQLIERLDALVPGKLQQKQRLFQELFPSIERALARAVPQKDLVAELARAGLSLSLGGFRAALAAERSRRAEIGDVLCCETCGSPTYVDQSETKGEKP